MLLVLVSVSVLFSPSTCFNISKGSANKWPTDGKHPLTRLNVCSFLIILFLYFVLSHFGFEVRNLDLIAVDPGTKSLHAH